MFTETTRPVLNFQVASAIRQAESVSAFGVWEFPNEAELAEELFSVISNPLPFRPSPEISPEDFERFAQGFLA